MDEPPAPTHEPFEATLALDEPEPAEPSAWVTKRHTTSANESLSRKFPRAGCAKRVPTRRGTRESVVNSVVEWMAIPGESRGTRGKRCRCVSPLFSR
jgi:hypothetical protein